MISYKLQVLILTLSVAITSYSPAIYIKEKNPYPIDFSFFYPLHHQGKINTKELNECSGILCSQNNPGNYIWAINDGGDLPRIFLLNKKAELQCTYFLNGAKNHDWEELAGYLDSSTYTLWIGDLGTNTNKRTWVNLLTFTEPLYSFQKTDTLKNFTTYYVKYPDKIRNTEAFVIDQQTKELYFFSKEADSSVVFSISIQELQSNDSSTLHLLYKLPIPYVTGASLSADGLALLLKNYSDVYYFRLGKLRLKNMSDAQICRIDYTREPQGESISWAWGNQGFYTLSEQTSNFITPMLCYYKRNLPSPKTH